MPELPEVETIVRQLHKNLPGRTIEKVVIRVPKMVLPLNSKTFVAKLKNQSITSVRRVAKVIVIGLSSGDFILIHLKMTGQLIWQPSTGRTIIGGHPQPNGGVDLPHKHTHAEFHFTDGSVLYFNDQRKFGWIKLVNETEKNTLLSSHGVEPLSKKFTPEIFIELATKYPGRTIKYTLLDQKLIAGLGNIYADEACFLAQIRPDRRVSSLNKGDLLQLHQRIIEVLKLSISKKGTSARNYVTSDGTRGGFVPYLNVYGRAGDKCKRCNGTITKIKLNGRGTHFCQDCQK